MNSNMKRNVLSLLLVMVLAPTAIFAQTTNPCPGLKNPNNFVGYSGQTGTKISQSPNPMGQGQTGMSFTSQVYVANELATLTSSKSSSCASGTLEDNSRFRIMTYNEGTGSNAGKDPNTGYVLPYVPRHLDSSLTKSVRVGQCRVSAEAEALYYTLPVKPQNALLTIYYAIVIEAPGHGTNSDPAFVVRVTKKQNGQWRQISDTLCYMVSSTPQSNGGSVTIGQNGWHQFGSGYSAVYYKDWSKAVVSLNDYLWDTVRIEMMIGDCYASGHYGYCYIAGDCQAMSIASSGCPAGETDVVDTLRAPKGLLSYVWSKSASGPVENIYNVPSTLNFTQLTNASTNNTYLARIEDFHLTEGAGAGRDTNHQTLMCTMTSALDPAKLITSKVYVNLDNTKPICASDTTKRCDGTIILKNTSFVPGISNGVVKDSTYWMVYDNTLCQGTPIATYRGETMSHQFSDHGYYGVTMRAMSPQSTCFTDKNMVVNAMRGDVTPIRLQAVGPRGDGHILCDGDSVTLIDLTTPAVKHKWVFEDTTYMGNSAMACRSISRDFDHFTNPFTLFSYNGDYILNDTNQADTIWCFNTLDDTIEVFVHPELTVTGDVIVCVGSPTDAHVAADVEGCNFDWYTRYNGTQSDFISRGPVLAVQPPRDTTTYFVKVTSAQGCVAWDSITTFLVRPQLKFSPETFSGNICPGQSVMMVGSHADHYTWSAQPEDESIVYLNDTTIQVSPKQTTVYTMIGHGSNNCDAEPLQKQVTVYPYPELKVSLSPSFIDSEDPKVTFNDDSKYGVGSAWTFGNSSPMIGNPVSHTFDNLANDSIAVHLTSYNALGCPSDTDFYMPVRLFAVWIPNTFTPNRSDNNYFRILTVNELEYFSIHIYDRDGRLVYTSKDPNFAWDGTHDGKPCPQGTFIYTIRYRRPSTTDVISRQGTISLIR